MVGISTKSDYNKKFEFSKYKFLTITYYHLLVYSSMYFWFLVLFALGISYYFLQDKEKKSSPDIECFLPYSPPCIYPKPNAKGNDVTIFFGSQTGTAEDFSYTLKQKAQGKGLRTQIVDLEDFEFVVFLLFQTFFFI